MRDAGTDPSVQTVTSTICPHCGVGCVVDLHVQDERILTVTSPLDSSVTGGHLCVKGRFGFEFVNERPSPRERRMHRSAIATRRAADGDERVLTDADLELLDRARTAALATIAPDGHARLVPIATS